MKTANCGSILPHLIGNIMPAGLLNELSYCGADNAEFHQMAVKPWDDYHETLFRVPLDSKRPGRVRIACKRRR